MGVLRKKIRASTLMETLVATSIIIIVFVVSSLVLNNTFRNVVYNDTFGVQNRMEELQYYYSHEQLQLPYEEDFGAFTIYMTRELRKSIRYVVIEATNNKTAKGITLESIDELQ